MACVKKIATAPAGESKKRLAAVMALGVCCYWWVRAPNALGQVTGSQGPRPDPAAATEHHQQHRHGPEPTPENAPKGQSSAKLTIPDVTLLDQHGREVRFYTDLVKGKTVAINFIFTSCTVVCPPLGANFGKLQSMFGERVGKDVYLITVSTDPEADTPARLRTWGARFGAKPGWTLVTGEKSQVDKLLLALTGDIARKGEHSAVVLLGSDARGKWAQAYGLAPPARLLKLLDEVSQ